MKAPVEIERKFLLNTSLAKALASHRETTFRPVEHYLIEQVYMPDSGGWTIRARSVMTKVTERSRVGEWQRSETEYYLTLKRRLTDLTCTEVEKELHAQEYLHMRELARHRPLVKRRHFMHGTGFVIDEFLNPEFERNFDTGDYRMVVAEIELDAEDQPFDRPHWLGEEVHRDWSNRALAQALSPR